LEGREIEDRDLGGVRVR
jgi:hypothetical protein